MAGLVASFTVCALLFGIPFTVCSFLYLVAQWESGRERQP